MREEQTFEPPREFNKNNVCFWESTSKTLKVAKEKGEKQAGVFLTKAKKFLDMGCIERINGTNWICKPIKNYNNTIYRIKITENGLECDCQGFNKKLKDYNNGISNTKPICSHIIGVKQFCFIESKGTEQI